MSDPGESVESGTPAPDTTAHTPGEGSDRNPFLVALFAWLLPGAGHFYLGKRARSFAFFCVVTAFTLAGFGLGGKLAVPESGRPLSYLHAFGNLGMGPPYPALVAGGRVSNRVLMVRAGDPRRVTYEHGTTCLLTAGIMNLLLMLDAWDIATGRKE